MTEEAIRFRLSWANVDVNDPRIMRYSQKTGVDSAKCRNAARRELEAAGIDWRREAK